MRPTSPRTAVTRASAARCRQAQRCKPRTMGAGQLGCARFGRAILSNRPISVILVCLADGTAGLLGHTSQAGIQQLRGRPALVLTWHNQRCSVRRCSCPASTPSRPPAAGPAPLRAAQTATRGQREAGVRQSCGSQDLSRASPPKRVSGRVASGRRGWSKTTPLHPPPTVRKPTCIFSRSM